MKTYEYILGDLQKKIEQGVYKPEEQLPSLRELAKIYNTTPVTAKKSLAILEERGYIYVVKRKGFFVASTNNKIYTMIFNEIKSVDAITDIALVSVEEVDTEAVIGEQFKLSVPENSRCLKLTRELKNGSLPIGLDMRYLIHNVRGSSRPKNPERLMASLNLVLNNYDILKKLEIRVMTDNAAVQEALFLDKDEPVFCFYQEYRTVNGQLVGVSETYVPCEEIQLKMKY